MNVLIVAWEKLGPQGQAKSCVRFRLLVDRGLAQRDESGRARQHSVETRPEGLGYTALQQGVMIYELMDREA